MRILFVLENFPPNIGGVETLFGRLVDNLRERGHEARIVTTQHPKRDKALDHITEVSARSRYAFTLKACWPTIRLAQWADIVHTTSYNAAFPALMAKWWHRKPTLITFHEYWRELWHRLPYISPLSARLHAAFESVLIRGGFHQYVGVSQYTSDRLSARIRRPERVSMIYNGLDYTALRGQQHRVKSPRFVYYGRCGISKGLDLLMEAIPMLAQKDIKAHIGVITSRASGPKIYDDLTAVAKKYPHLISILPYMPKEDLQGFLCASTAVLIPSYSEGFGFSAAEAVGLGIPIIHSGQGSLPEVVGGRHLQMKSMTGTALAEAIEKGMKGDWEQAPPKEFHLSTCVDSYLALYTKMLNS